MARIGGFFTKKREVQSFFVNSYGNNQTRGIYTFNIDIDNGELLFRRFFKTPTNPSYSFSFGRFVCITYKNRTGTAADGGICSYASTAETLALISRISDSGKTYVHACTNGDHETADKIFAVDYYNGQIMVGGILKKKLKAVLKVHDLKGSSVHPTKQTRPHPSYIEFLPDNKGLYVVDLGTDKITVFDVEDNGNLVEDTKHSFSVEPGSGPSKMIFSKDGKFAYVLNELSNTIMVYGYENRTFTYLQTVDTYDKEQFPNEETIASQICFDEKDKFAFVTNRGHDSVSSFSRDGETGLLKYVDFMDTGANPVDVLVFNQKWLVIACQKSGIVEVIEYSEKKAGLLFDTEYSYLVNEPVCLTKFVDITERRK